MNVNGTEYITEVDHNREMQKSKQDAFKSGQLKGMMDAAEVVSKINFEIDGRDKGTITSLSEARSEILSAHDKLKGTV